MFVVYAHQEFPDLDKSIFLAGPTPRSPEAVSWRHDATRYLEGFGFDGAVFIPEPEDGDWRRDYTDQIDWELEGLNKASCILFWIPRDLEVLPAFTTNVEFGKFYDSGKVILGFPRGAPKIRYLEYLARKEGVRICHSLESALREAVFASRLASQKRYFNSI